MTNKITVVASEVRVNDHIYNGTGSNAHPTFAWETVTEIRSEDGLILLITGNAKGPHGEFWLEPFVMKPWTRLQSSSVRLSPVPTAPADRNTGAE